MSIGPGMKEVRFIQPPTSLKSLSFLSARATESLSSPVTCFCSGSHSDIVARYGRRQILCSVGAFL